MNEITVKFKHAQKFIKMFSEANDVLFKDGFIQFRVKGIFGNYRTLMMIERENVEFVHIKSKSEHIKFTHE